MYLITGAAGLIGSAVAREMNSRGHTKLILTDHLSKEDKWKNLSSIDYLQYYEKDEFLDLLETGDFDTEDLKGILHLGACSSTTEADASYLVENNYRYSQKLAELARELRIRMVYASSAATYGDGSMGFDDDLNQIEKLRPLNGYGYSKHMFDLWLKKTGFDDLFAGIKYFNVYGPNEYHKGSMQSVVLKGYRQIRDSGKIQLFKSYRDDYKDGEQMRDFLYVKDAAAMTVDLLVSDNRPAGLFNAGSGQASTWLQLVNAIFEAAGKKPEIEFIEMPEHMREKYQYYTCAPVDRLRKAGYNKEITPLADAVKDYVSNYLMPGEINA